MRTRSLRIASSAPLSPPAAQPTPAARAPRPHPWGARGRALRAVMAGVVATSSLLWASTSRAAQTMILDTGEYVHVSDNTARNAAVGKANASLKGSHAFFKTTTSGASSWISPNDYRGGEYHVQVDVLEKPSAAEVRLSYCMDDRSVTCGSNQVIFTKTGTYRTSGKEGTGYTSGTPDYGAGFRIAAVILRDGGAREGKKLDLGEGFIGEPDYSRYFPLKMRVRVWLVTPGATFVPPNDGMDAGAGPTDAGVATDAGATDEDASAKAADAQAPKDGTPSPSDDPTPDDADESDSDSMSRRPSGADTAPGCSQGVGSKDAPLAWILAGGGAIVLARRRKRAEDQG